MLFDFGNVLMLKRFISVKRIHSLRMMRIRRRFRARTRRTRFRVNDNFSRQQSAFHHRRKRKQSRRRKTSGIRDIFRRFDLFAVRFGQTVNKFFLQFVGGVFEFVKFFENVLIVNPKIARQINDFHVWRQIAESNSKPDRAAERKTRHQYFRVSTNLRAIFQISNRSTRKDFYALRRPLFPRVRSPSQGRFPHSDETTESAKARFRRNPNRRRLQFLFSCHFH